MVLSPRGNARYFLDGNRQLWYMLPWYSAPTHGNARYFLDGNRPLWYIFVRYSATTVMYGIFYIFILWVTPACVWFKEKSERTSCCDASTFTQHENHQTSNLNMKYSGEDNKRQCPDHRQTFAANSCMCLFSSHLFWTLNSLEVPAGVVFVFFVFSH